MVAKSYEGMFLVDNRFANRDWNDEELQIANLLAKHGGEVLRGRRWAEKKLAYEIKGHKRAIFYLLFFKMPPSNLAAFRRDIELSEHVLRNLLIMRNETEMTNILAKEEQEEQAAEARRSSTSRPNEDVEQFEVPSELDINNFGDNDDRRRG